MMVVAIHTFRVPFDCTISLRKDFSVFMDAGSFNRMPVWFVKFFLDICNSDVV